MRTIAAVDLGGWDQKHPDELSGGMLQRVGLDRAIATDLTGCAPGRGCERVIERQLMEFDLRDTIAHKEGAYNPIIADTIARNLSCENVLYYIWTPYWVSGVLIPGDNVEWLEVAYSSLPDGAIANTVYEGKGLGFAVDYIRLVATDSFLRWNPAARILFDVAVIDINDSSAQNNLIVDVEDDSDDIDRHVDEWIADNKRLYNS